MLITTGSLNAFVPGYSCTVCGDHLFVDGTRYKDTPGLWELMVKKRPEDFEPEDLDAFEDILLQTNAIYQAIVVRPTRQPL